MHDHGDDFGAWCGDQSSTDEYRTEEQWLTTARYVRHAADKILDAPLPLCLPGEPQECGRSAQQHVLAWAAVLKAAAQHVIDDAAPAPAYAAFSGSVLYKRHLAAMGTEAQGNV